MTRLSKILMTLLVTCALVLLAGCEEDETATTTPPVGPPNTGSANFVRYVSIGNSLTAGFQSNALSERDQVSSFPNLIAKQVQVAFEQPLMMNPGIGSRIRLVNLTPTLVNEAGVNPLDPASNLNANLQRPYNNLGIPGAVLYDILDTTGASSNFVAKSIARGNPFFAQILRSQLLGRSVFQQARALSPTFITLWIGNNDVLGYAVSGGTSGSNVLPPNPHTLPTEALLFDVWFRQLIDSVRTTGAGIVTANIPDVSAIPFFTTLGPQIHAKLPKNIVLIPRKDGGVDTIITLTPIRYQQHGNNGVAFDTTTLSGASSDPLILLTGGAYAPLLGHPTGKWYRDNGIAVPPGIDTTQPFGFHPQNPWLNALTLDEFEIKRALEAIDNFNASIDSIAANRGIGVVNIHGIFNNILQHGLYVSDLGTFSTSFILGGVFSYDGVHPSSRGEAIIANEFITVINTKFNAQILPVTISSVAGLPIGKVSAPQPTMDYERVDWKEFLEVMGGGIHQSFRKFP